MPIPRPRFVFDLAVYMKSGNIIHIRSLLDYNYEFDRGRFVDLTVKHFLRPVGARPPGIDLGCVEAITARRVLRIV